MKNSKTITALLKVLWAKYPLTTFALCYAVVAVLLTALFQYAPAARNLEYALFDKIQNDRAIDSKSNAKYSRYADALEQLCLINLDSSLIDPETDRVNKKQLARLLHKLQEPAKGTQAILIDYLFKPKRVESEENIALSVAIQDLGEKAVLPIGMRLDNAVGLRGRHSTITMSDVQIDSALVPYPFRVGYTTPFSDPSSGKHRFFKYKLDDDGLFSLPALGNIPKEAIPNGFTELHFLLRNKDKEGEERAVLTYQASDVLNGTLNEKTLSELLQGKLVVIGLMDDYRTKYSTPIDVFSTPVDAEMTGSLLLTNAWLNLKANSYLRKGSLWLIFLMNILIGLSAGLRFTLENRKALAVFLNTFVKLAISLVLFYYLSLTFLENWHIKVSLGMSLLFYQHQYTFWTWWKQRADHYKALFE